MGSVIIFPTDTVYGIGCSVYDKEAIDRIYKIKHRSYNKPLAVLCANIDQIEKIAYVNDIAKKLISVFLPGPLTLILDAKDSIKESMNLEKVGIRIPNSKFAIKLLMKTGPLATTSVNESGEVPLNNYDEIVLKYGNVVDEIYKSNDFSSNISSTVVMVLDNKIKVLRNGEVTLKELNKAIDYE